MSLYENNENSQYAIDYLENSETNLNSYALTPPRSRHSSTVNTEPLTPLANLKILLSAASPEIRNRDNGLNNEINYFRAENATVDCNNQPSVGNTDDAELNYEFMDQEEEIEESPSCIAHVEKLCCGNRKEKSLGLLCERFLALFPEYVDPSLEGLSMCLDEIAGELGVERRRVYDIVNILESLQLVSRVAKNSYVWHGRNNLPHTLSQLKAMAQANHMAQRLEMSEKQDDWEPFDQIDDGGKREKSLGIMCQKFLMLLMVSPNSMLNLEQSARVLIGFSEGESFESNKYKTKIRRLYDIANVLNSLNLIKKVQFPDCKGKRPVFQYTGPELDLSLLTAEGSAKIRRPNTKHSMLSPSLSPDNSDKNSAMRILNAPSFRRFSSFQQSAQKSSESKSNKKTLCRHASLEQICAVVEHERAKLYQPNSISPSDKENVNCASRMQYSKPSIRSAPNTVRANSKSSEVNKTEGSPIVVALTRGQLENMLKNMNSQHEGRYLIKMNSVLKPAVMKSNPQSAAPQLLRERNTELCTGVERDAENFVNVTPTDENNGQRIRSRSEEQPSRLRTDVFPFNSHSKLSQIAQQCQQQLSSISTKQPKEVLSISDPKFWSDFTHSSPDISLEDLISPVFSMSQRKRSAAFIPLETPPSIGYGINKALVSVLPPASKRLAVPLLTVVDDPITNCDIQNFNETEYLPDGVSASVARRLPLYD